MLFADPPIVNASDRQTYADSFYDTTGVRRYPRSLSKELRMSSALLTKELAQQAISIVGPAIAYVMDKARLTKRNALAIVVLDPTKEFTRSGTLDQPLPILHEANFGSHPDDWPHDFRGYARKKSLVSWRTGLPSRLVQQSPYLYQFGDIKYAGSVVENGLIVAASGVEAHFDEMFARMVAAACWGLTMHAMKPILDSDVQVFI